MPKVGGVSKLAQLKRITNGSWGTSPAAGSNGGLGVKPSVAGQLFGKIAILMPFRSHYARF